MRICFLSSTHPPLDKRVFVKEAVSLAAHGFEVIHLAPDTRAREWVQEGVRIVTFRRPLGTRARLVALPKLFWLALREAADCYHCNEVDSWAVGLLLKLVRGKRIVFDVHEHYPSDFAERYCPAPVRRLAAGLMRFSFRLLTPFTDRLVFAKKYLAQDFGIGQQSQILVENFAAVSKGGLLRKTVEGRERSGATLIHLGLIAKVKGWPQLLGALAIARARCLRVMFVGSFADDSKAEFHDQVRELGLTGRVILEGWMAFDDMYERVLAADIGVLVLQPRFHSHAVALPHKLFDYMMAGLPVIAPIFSREVAEIVVERDCGILVDTSDSQAIAAALDRLASDPVERQRLGSNGRKAVVERYNWEHESRKLVGMYQALAVQPRSSAASNVPSDCSHSSRDKAW